MSTDQCFSGQINESDLPLAESNRMLIVALQSVITELAAANARTNALLEIAIGRITEGTP